MNNPFVIYLHDNIEQCYELVKHIIRKHQYLVTLPTFEMDSDVNERISALNHFMKESSINETLGKLEHLTSHFQKHSCHMNHLFHLKPRFDATTHRVMNCSISIVDKLQISSHCVSTPVEIVRSNCDDNKHNFLHRSSFHSPSFDTHPGITTSKKCQASTSRKKGADLYQKQLEDEDIFHPENEQVT